MSNVYEDLEDIAGHKLTMVAPMLAGVTTYYCENCGAIFKISFSERRAGSSLVVLFHVPAWCFSTVDACQTPHAEWTRPPGFVSLSKKLTLLMIDGFVKDDDAEDGEAAKVHERLRTHILERDE